MCQSVSPFIPTVHTMSPSVPMPVSFYKSDLEVMTAFVQDRSKFLDTVVDAIQLEGKNDAATKMISLLENSAFLQFMPALLTDKNTALCAKALLALGNLIGSDNHKVASAAFTVAEHNFSTIVNCARNDKIRAVSAYVIYALALRINALLSDKRAPLITPIVTIAKELVKSPCDRAARDMLFVLNMFGTCADVATSDLLRLLTSSSRLTRNMALSLLATQVSLEGFDTAYCDAVYDGLRTIIMDGKKRATPTRRELAWAFSNLVTEDGMADKFFQDSKLFDVVVHKMLDDDDKGVNSENAWILTNAIIRADRTKLSDEFLCRLQTELNNYINMCFFRFQNSIPVVTQIMAIIEGEISARAKAKLAALSTTVPALVIDDDMDIDYDASWHIKESNACEVLATPPCEVDETYMPPSAYELLAKGAPRKATSRVVHDLIRSVEANGNGNTPVPRDTLLTVDDLDMLDELGFSIVRGCVGISARVTSRL